MALTGIGGVWNGSLRSTTTGQPPSVRPFSLRSHPLTSRRGQSRERNYYLLDVYRARLLFPDLKRKLRQLAELHKASHVIIEDTASGIQLLQELRLEGFASLQAVKPKGSKYERLIARTPLIEAGKVWIPDQAHWLEAFLHEVAMFPNGRHDDQIDSLSQALAWLHDTGGPAHWLWVMDEVDRMRAEDPNYVGFYRPRTYCEWE